MTAWFLSFSPFLELHLRKHIRSLCSLQDSGINMMLKLDEISEGAELEWRNFALGRDMCNWSQEQDQWKISTPLPISIHSATWLCSSSHQKVESISILLDFKLILIPWPKECGKQCTRSEPRPQELLLCLKVLDFVMSWDIGYSVFFFLSALGLSVCQTSLI